MLIDVPDANEVQWEKPASNWELRPTALSSPAEAQLNMAASSCGGASRAIGASVSPSVSHLHPYRTTGSTDPGRAGSRSRSRAVRGKAHGVFLQLGRHSWRWKPRFLYLRTVKGLHLICEPVKYYTGNGLQLSVTGNLILVSCGAMLLLPVKARTHQSINNP